MGLFKGLSKGLGDLVDWDKNRTWLIPLAAAALGGYAGYAAYGSVGLTAGATAGATAGSQSEQGRLQRRAEGAFKRTKEKERRVTAQTAFEQTGGRYANASRALLRPQGGKRVLGT